MYYEVDPAYDFESAEDAVEALMSDVKQRRIYEIICGLHPDDVTTYLSGAIDFADTFGIACDGLHYLLDEIYELGVEAAINMIDDIWQQM